MKVWGNVVTVEWADPIEDPDPEVMAKVRHRAEKCICHQNVFFVRKLNLVYFSLGQGAVCEELSKHCYRGDT